MSNDIFIIIVGHSFTLLTLILKCIIDESRRRADHTRYMEEVMIARSDRQDIKDELKVNTAITASHVRPDLKIDPRVKLLVESKFEALKREYQLKQLTKAEKQALIKGSH